MTVGHNIRDGKAEWVPDDTTRVRHTADSITSDALDVLYERLHLLDGMRQNNLDAACAAVARAEQAEATVERVREWANGNVVTGRSEFGNGYREAMRDIRDLLPDPAQRPIAATTKELT